MIPWQQAVYTRVGVNDTFVFSHMQKTTIAKHFPASLAVRDMSGAASTRSANFESVQQATVLILVTGKWAQHISLDSSFTPVGSKYRPPLYSLYDHMERLCAVSKSSKHCSELTEDYMAMQYYSTLSHFSRGEDHSWKLSSVVPMLSDIVILPRLLEPTRIKTILASFSRAMRKCMRDSLIMAEETKYRENTHERANDKTLI